MKESDTVLQVEQEEGSKPDIAQLRDAFQGPLGIRSLALTGLFVLAMFYTLYFAKAFFLPVVLAVLLNFLLSPLVRGLRRTRIPEPLSAGVIIVLLVAGVSVLAYNLSGPLSHWAGRAPEILRKVELQTKDIKGPVERVTEATAQVEKMTEVEGGEQPTKVVMQNGTLTSLLMDQTFAFFLGLTVMLILLFFLLAAGDMFLRKLVTMLPNFKDKKRAVQIAHEIEGSISTYLATVTAINVALGVVVGTAMMLLGMPSPYLWGAIAALLNYVPFLGAIVTTIVIGLASAATFNEMGQIIAPPAIFYAINAVEGNFITPMILGRRLTLNPVVIFVGLIFWGWIWGIPGALLSVPLLVVFKTFCDHIKPLASIGEFLED